MLHTCLKLKISLAFSIRLAVLWLSILASLFCAVANCLHSLCNGGVKYAIPSSAKCNCFCSLVLEKVLRPCNMRNQRYHFSSWFNIWICEAREVWGGSSQLSAGRISRALPFTWRFYFHLWPYQDSGRVSQTQKDRTKDELLLCSCSPHAATQDRRIMAGEVMATSQGTSLRTVTVLPLWHSLVLSFAFKRYCDVWRTVDESLWLLEGFGNLNYPHLKKILFFEHRLLLVILLRRLCESSLLHNADKWHFQTGFSQGTYSLCSALNCEQCLVP